MIILTTYTEKDKNTGKSTGQLLISHGTDINSLKDIVLPQVPVQSIGYYHKELGEWVLKN